MATIFNTPQRITKDRVCNETDLNNLFGYWKTNKMPLELKNESKKYRQVIFTFHKANILSIKLVYTMSNIFILANNYITT